MARVIVQTDRLHLREWERSDARAFQHVAGDPRTMRFITGGRPLTAEETARFVNRQIEVARLAGWCRWALELRAPAPGEPTGAVGFCGPGPTFAPEIELGWWVHPDLWGRGLATEAALAAREYCFAVIGFDRLICMVHPDNHASLRVAEKVGFVYQDATEHDGVPLLRHAQANPLPEPPRDPRFKRDTEGLPVGSILEPRSG